MRFPLSGALVLALGVLLTPTAPVQAAPLRAGAVQSGTALAGSDVDNVRRDLAESTDAMVAAVTALREAEAALPSARSAAQSAMSRLADTLRREDAAATVRGHAQVTLVESERASEEAGAAAAERKQQLGVLAREAYQKGPAPSWLALLDTGSLPDAYQRLAVLDEISTAQSGAAHDLATLASAYDARRAALVVARDKFSAAHANLEAEVASRTTAEEVARTSAELLGGVVRERSTALAAAQAAVADDTARYAELTREATELQAVLRARALQVNPNSTGSPGGQPGTLSYPVQGPISSPFGMRRHPITGVYKLHTGTDFAVPCGTPVHAAADGVVLTVGFNTAYGNRTVVDDGVIGGVSVSTTYNHQTSIAVAAGQHVVRGQIIGFSGTTGYSTGCHLHFEVLVDGNFVDPMTWL